MIEGDASSASYFFGAAAIAGSIRVHGLGENSVQGDLAFVDVTNHRMVWQGVAMIDVNDKVAQQLRNAIFTATNKVLEQYPHTAGK